MSVRSALPEPTNLCLGFRLETSFDMQTGKIRGGRASSEGRVSFRIFQGCVESAGVPVGRRGASPRGGRAVGGKAVCRKVFKRSNGPRELFVVVFPTLMVGAFNLEAKENLWQSARGYDAEALNSGSHAV